MKTSQLEQTEIEHINQSNVPIYNTVEERNVGFSNYEIGTRAKKNVESASQKMILNKSRDLIDKKDNAISCKFWREAIKIKELKLKWSEKIASLQEKGFLEKDVIT